MKRFLVFAGSNYYPCGGWSDFVGAYDSLEEARAAAEERKTLGQAYEARGQTFRCTPDDWAHVVDLEQMAEVR